MEKREYNGWHNYETWNVALWFGNDSSQYWDEMATECYERAEADDTFTRAENATFELADAMKEFVEENTPETVGMYADLLGAALSEVNWHEIAEHYIDEVDKEEEAA